MTEQVLHRGTWHRLAVIRHAQKVMHDHSTTSRSCGISRSSYDRLLSAS
jgi:hypothetical protein